MPNGWYSIAEICERFGIKRSSFNDLRRRGELPFLEELEPRIGKRARYRRQPIDNYFAGRWRPPTRREQQRQAPKRKTASTPETLTRDTEWMEPEANSTSQFKEPQP